MGRRRWLRAASVRAVDHDGFRRWIEGYERAWRSPGTALLAELFAQDAVYLHSPYAEPVQPLTAIERDWEEQREGADEDFSMEVEILAVVDDHPGGPLGIARMRVRYGEPARQEYRDIWLVWFDSAGRARRFEEWPNWPGQPWAANQ
ncbi:MAG: nuclear transport factor 2 family protein [Pseudonocardiales bacterium]|nr:nuclear transport factor 2 family protein [Pseudonocardiales bacterium]